MEPLAELRELAPPRRRPPPRDLEAGGEPMPYAVDRLLPWAVTDNGDVAYFRVEGEPGDWTVVVNEGRGPEWQAFPGGAVAFLLAWLAGRERVSVFPDDVPDPEDPFTPWS